MTGEPAEALEKLLVEALFGSDEALTAYTEGWSAAHGSEGGLDEHLWAMRLELAPTLPEFTLADYDGENVSSKEFAGDVLLITAWNPG
jgi:hypothetical protein